MPMDKSGRVCKEHGGDVTNSDRYWLCDKCAIKGYNKCNKCGGDARGFGEAMYEVAGCEKCNGFVCGVGINAKKLWNEGVRGVINWHNN